MSRMTRPAAFAAVVAVMTAFALTGCGARPDDASGPEDPATTAFVACLKAAGVEAKISDSAGLVMVRDTQEILSDDGTGTVTSSADGTGRALLVEAGTDGNWVAAQDSSYFETDPTTQDAYAGCEKEHPDFRQPPFDPMSDPGAEIPEEQIEAALAFAECARAAGFAWVADPKAESGYAIELPSGIAEDEFRALLEACGDEAEGAIGWAVDGELGFDLGAVLDDAGITSGSVVSGREPEEG